MVFIILLGLPHKALRLMLTVFKCMFLNGRVIATNFPTQYEEWNWFWYSSAETYFYPAKSH